MSHRYNDNAPRLRTHDKSVPRIGDIFVHFLKAGYWHGPPWPKEAINQNKNDLYRLIHYRLIRFISPTEGHYRQPGDAEFEIIAPGKRMHGRVMTSNIEAMILLIPRHRRGVTR